MAPCIFCAIVAQREKAQILCESKQFICFAPLEQEVPGHMIIASKVHYQSLLDAPIDIGSDLFAVCKKLATRSGESIGASGFNLLNANEAVAQQSVMHLHFHFLPRRAGDEINAWPVLPGVNQDAQKSV